LAPCCIRNSAISAAGRSIQGAINVVLGFGFIFLSGFALLPALIVVLITEAFYIRGVLTYAIGGAIRRLRLLSRADPVRSRNHALRWHCAPPSRNPDGAASSRAWSTG